jgi:hypothetical protein
VAKDGQSFLTIGGRDNLKARLLQIRSYEFDDFAFVVYDKDLVGHGECIMGLLDSYPPELDRYGVRGEPCDI